ncbi:MAG TPA: hypothetical protein VLK34_09895 [Nocardioidaceae bacterium]|nr:hypothetical protein [Nocardioidaceae bacterium]
MAINTTSTLPRTPLSTKIVVWLGLVLVAIGGGIAITDHLRSSTATENPTTVPAQASGFVVPGSEHLMQFIGLLVVGVCVAGFLVLSRSAARRT